MSIPPYIARLRAKVGTDLLMVTAADGLVWDRDGRLLLIRRRDTGLWTAPGGIVDAGEPPAAALAREVWEEAGLRVVPERLVAVYGGERYRQAYPNGDQVEFTILVFDCRPLDDAAPPRPRDGEAVEVGYFGLDDLPPLHWDGLAEAARHARTSERTLFHWDPAWLDALR